MARHRATPSTRSLAGTRWVSIPRNRAPRRRDRPPIDPRSRASARSGQCGREDRSRRNDRTDADRRLRQHTAHRPDPRWLATGQRWPRDVPAPGARSLPRGVGRLERFQGGTSGSGQRPFPRPPGSPTEPATGGGLLPRLLQPDVVAAVPRPRPSADHRSLLVGGVPGGQRTLRGHGWRARTPQGAAACAVGARLPPDAAPAVAASDRLPFSDPLFPPHTLPGARALRSVALEKGAAPRCAGGRRRGVPYRHVPGELPPCLPVPAARGERRGRRGPAAGWPLGAVQHASHLGGREGTDHEGRAAAGSAADTTVAGAVRLAYRAA